MPDRRVLRPARASWAGIAAGALAVAAIVAAEGCHGSAADQTAGSGAAGSGTGSPPVAESSPPPPPPLANPWIRIEAPRPPVAIGLLPRNHDEYPKSLVGLRPSRKVLSPAAPFELQQHEVTWGELSPWLASRHLEVRVPAWAGSDPARRDRLPATDVPWKTAGEYCASIGGALPMEAQWELAARGAERRPHAWGSAQLDRLRTRALGGPDAVPQPALASTQDRTPDGIHDLIGNVQEWTADLWIEDAPGQDESWVKDGETTFRAVRGLPLRGTGPVPDEGAAYREPLCATGTCAAAATSIQELIGFRCARNKEGTP